MNRKLISKYLNHLMQLTQDILCKEDQEKLYNLYHKNTNKLPIHINDIFIKYELNSHQIKLIKLINNEFARNDVQIEENPNKVFLVKLLVKERNSNNKLLGKFIKYALNYEDNLINLLVQYLITFYGKYFIGNNDVTKLQYLNVQVTDCLIKLNIEMIEFNKILFRQMVLNYFDYNNMSQYFFNDVYNVENQIHKLNFKKHEFSYNFIQDDFCIDLYLGNVQTVNTSKSKISLGPIKKHSIECINFKDHIYYCVNLEEQFNNEFVHCEQINDQL
jgi:hypothetical protein